MNWMLVFRLSLFGLLMAVGTVFVIPSSVEPLCWLAIFLVCGYLIAARSGGRHFLHGLLLGLANSVWMTGGHVLLFRQYMDHHPKEAEMMASMPLAQHPRLMMLLTGRSWACCQASSSGCSRGSSGSSCGARRPADANGAFQNVGRPFRAGGLAGLKPRPTSVLQRALRGS